MLIPIPILIDLCPHLVASMTAVHENLSGGLQTLKYCIYVYFDNRPVYEASLLSLWKHTTVCKISLCISCWIKNSWVLSPESWICVYGIMSLSGRNAEATYRTFIRQRQTVFCKVSPKYLNAWPQRMHSAAYLSYKWSIYHISKPP